MSAKCHKPTSLARSGHKRGRQLSGLAANSSRKLRASFNPPERVSKNKPSVRSGDKSNRAAFIVQTIRLG